MAQSRQGFATSVPAVVNLDGTDTAGAVLSGTWNGQKVGPAFIPTFAGGVTSVAMTVPTILAVAGSPITTSGTFALTLATQVANAVFAGPTTGGAVAPTFRALVAADLPAGYDATLVHIAGTETVTGAKTFSAATTTLGATSTLLWTGLSKVTSPADGTVLITSNAAGPATLVVGTGTADGAGRVRFGDNTASGVVLRKYGSSSALGLFSGNESVFGTLSLQTLRPQFITGQDAATNVTVSQIALTTASKAASYTVTVVDSFTAFDNTGAGSQAVFTLPTSVVGLTYTFANVAAGATFLKVLATGTDKIAQAGVLGSAAGNLVSASIWSTVTITCIKAGTWTVTQSTGTAWTLT